MTLEFCVLAGKSLKYSWIKILLSGFDHILDKGLQCIYLSWIDDLSQKEVMNLEADEIKGWQDREG